MLLAIQNLIEYLNRNYFNDDKLEEEVITMTKSLYDPEVEKQGIQKGIQKGIRETARKLKELGVDNDIIIKSTGISKEEIEKL